MVERRSQKSSSSAPKSRASTTPQGRENQLINLAVDLAEKQLREGTASAQVIGHYLKAGSTKEYLERKRLEMDVELMKAKQAQMESVVRIEELYENAIRSMRGYQGEQIPEEEGDDV